MRHLMHVRHDEVYTMHRNPFIALLALFTLSVGCTSPQEEPPDDPDTTGGSATDPQDDDATSPTESTDDTVGTDTNSSVDDTTAGDTGEECLGENDCWNCSPNSPDHIINHCTDAACEPFENSQDRLPLLENDGSLPPLP